MAEQQQTLDSILESLHAQSDKQLIDRARSQFKGSDAEFQLLLQQYASLSPKSKGEFLVHHGLSSNDNDSSAGSRLSLAISAETGKFLRNLVLVAHPITILELGSSCGVSTLYFADALRSLGRGQVIATELDAWKLEQLEFNIGRTNLSGYVDIRPGDVFSTIRNLQTPVDLLFIDIWATGYLEAFAAVRPQLKSGSIVLADNMFTAAQELSDFRRAIEIDPSLSVTILDFESGLAFIVVR
jgi:predicted O-methyltransferase YrrM